MSSDTETPAAHILHWMSHRGAVRTAHLRQAVEGLYPDEPERHKTLTNTLRRRVLELGHARVLNEVGDLWEILPPYLVPLPIPTEDASRHAGSVRRNEALLLCGGRVPALLNALVHAADRVPETVVAENDLKDAPPRVTLTGPPDAVRETAQMLRIPIVDAAPRRLLARQWQRNNSWAETRLLDSRSDPTPLSHECKFWNWEAWAWQLGFPSRRAAAEGEGDLLPVTDRWGPVRFLVRHGAMWRCIYGESTAKYLAASLRGVSLARYDSDTRTLSASILPPTRWRARCVCAADFRRAKQRRRGLIISTSRPSWRRSGRMPSAKGSRQSKTEIQPTETKFSSHDQPVRDTRRPARFVCALYGQRAPPALSRSDR